MRRCGSRKPGFRKCSICHIVKCIQCLCEFPNFELISCFNLDGKKQTNSVALSPRANYTDWATATCRRNLVPTFVDRRMSRGQRGGSPTVVNFSFLDQSRTFSFQYSSFMLTRAEWTPFQTHCYSENVVTLMACNSNFSCNYKTFNANSLLLSFWTLSIVTTL
jgi:hypothetical protein